MTKPTRENFQEKLDRIEARSSEDLAQLQKELEKLVDIAKERAYANDKEDAEKILAIKKKINDLTEPK